MAHLTHKINANMSHIIPPNSNPCLSSSKTISNSAKYINNARTPKEVEPNTKLIAFGYKFIHTSQKMNAKE